MRESAMENVRSLQRIISLQIGQEKAVYFLVYLDEQEEPEQTHLSKNAFEKLPETAEMLKRITKWEIQIFYPKDAVRGIYVTRPG